MGLLKKQIRSLPADFTFGTTEYSGFPGKRSTQQSSSAWLWNVQRLYLFSEITAFWSLIDILNNIAILVFI